jgi:hypothetical protein
MIRTQISLTQAQHERLHRVARERGVSVAAVIRDAVDVVVPDEDVIAAARYAGLVALSGAFHSGHHDTSENHDDVLADEGGW